MRDSWYSYLIDQNLELRGGRACPGRPGLGPGPPDSDAEQIRQLPEYLGLEPCSQSGSPRSSLPVLALPFSDQKELGALPRKGREGWAQAEGGLGSTLGSEPMSRRHVTGKQLSGGKGVDSVRRKSSGKQEMQACSGLFFSQGPDSTRCSNPASLKSPLKVQETC